MASKTQIIFCSKKSLKNPVLRVLQGSRYRRRKANVGQAPSSPAVPRRKHRHSHRRGSIGTGTSGSQASIANQACDAGKDWSIKTLIYTTRLGKIDLNTTKFSSLKTWMNGVQSHVWSSYTFDFKKAPNLKFLSRGTKNHY